MRKVTKAVIPAAGFGTRLLPATKAVDKEMIPIINKPAIQYIVQEAIDSGIKDILIVLSRRKKAIKTYFGHNRSLEANLKAKKKAAMYKEVIKLANLCKITFVYQNKMLGLGNAISYAKRFAGKDPIAVLLGDDVIVPAEKTALKQCIEAYNQTKTSIIGVQPVRMSDVNKYGIVSPINKEDTKQSIFAIKCIVEKPNIAKAPSNFAALGRYILTPEIFKSIRKTKKDKSGEVQLTDAFKNLLKKEKIHACKFKGKRYDLGNKLGMVKATIDFALHDPQLRKDVLRHIKGVK